MTIKQELSGSFWRRWSRKIRRSWVETKTHLSPGRSVTTPNFQFSYNPSERFSLPASLSLIIFSFLEMFFSFSLFFIGFAAFFFSFSGCLTRNRREKTPKSIEIKRAVNKRKKAIKRQNLWHNIERMCWMRFNKSRAQPGSVVTCGFVRWWLRLEVT